MKTEDTLYVKILLWAYEKADTGFTRKELHEAFNLDSQQLEWQLRFFMPANRNNRLIDHYYSNQKPNLLALTDKGMSAAIEYLGSKEIKKAQTEEEIFKLSPEFHGVGINLRSFWKKIKSWF